jgi:hypothetical protein
MSRYLVLWKANASVWPTDPKSMLAVLEAAAGGADQLRKSGAITDIGWLTTEEGCAIFEADSKADVLGMLQGFSPYYSQSVQEIAPWEAGMKSMLESARQAASR